MNNSKKLMLVDEAVFNYLTCREEDVISNLSLQIFLEDAKGAFRIAIVTDRAPDDVRMDLTDADIPADLADVVEPWAVFEDQFAHVLISANTNASYRVNGHDFLLDPEDVKAPGYFRHFQEMYEDNLGFKATSEAFSSLSAMVAMADVTMKNAMAATYPDPKAVWTKIVMRPGVQALAGAAGNLEQRSWDKDHPQEYILNTLRKYFEYAAAGKRADIHGVRKNLMAVRHHIAFELRDRDLDGAYAADLPMDDPRNKLTDQHRQLIDGALKDIHHVVKLEPKS